MPETIRNDVNRLQEALRRDPGSRVFLQLAEAHRRTGDLDQARAVLERGLKRHPDYTGAHIVLAHVLGEQDRAADAEAAWSRVAELDPENALALRALADRARADGRREQALELLHRLAALEGDDPEVQAAIAELGGGGDEAADPPEAAEPPRPNGRAARREARAAAPEADAPPVVNRVQMLVSQPASAPPTGSAGVPLVEVLVRLLEQRDSVFRARSSLTRLLAAAIGRELELQPVHLDALALAALLCDVGEMSLGVAEGDGAQDQGVAVTLQLLEGIALPPGVHEAIAHQHEHWDGTGGPDGLREDAIPFAARILAVARASARLVEQGPGRQPLSVPAAIDEMQRRAGAVYDPIVVSVLRRVFAHRELHGIGYGWGGHVLIAHPGELRGLGVATQLHSNGYVTETAADPGAVRERLRRAGAQAVVLGARLPGDVAALIGEIRALPQMTTVPVVVIDADDAMLRVALLSAGADVCFASDVSFTEFKATLDALLRRSELVAGTPVMAGPGSRAFA